MTQTRKREPPGHEQTGPRPKIVIARPEPVRFPIVIAVPLTTKASDGVSLLLTVRTASMAAWVDGHAPLNEPPHGVVTDRDGLGPMAGRLPHCHR